MYDQVQVWQHGGNDLQFNASIVRPDPQQGCVTTGRDRLGWIDRRHDVTCVCPADAMAAAGL